MFDSVRGHELAPRSRIILSVLLSLVLHACVFLLALATPTRTSPPRTQAPREALRVTLLQGPGPTMAAPPPPSPPSAHEKTSPRREQRRAPATTVRPRNRPQRTRPSRVEPKPDAKEEEAPVTAAPVTADPEGGTPETVAPEALAHRQAGDVSGGVIGGVVGGVVGGLVGGVAGGQVGGTRTEVLPFGSGMTRPRKLSGPKPRYTREALAARVEGLMIVRCVITVEGRIEQCRVIRSLPYMEEAVLDALYAQRYQPVTSQGRPIPVEYTFNIRLSLPR
ncbi:energy transducer TonB [Archangium violaceum]|uniref:TonB C-terminal domain-containing protein n=1 Tax=Archangium violaceum Cb vi76 TaxID=1406225 RepID=A0A084SIH2_9BACT|nr:energy transducer TonB [Archangium violaceum]KFA88257.1 hypothetical protein Q664_42480 [Archangium violaceum Cb vi76]